MSYVSQVDPQAFSTLAPIDQGWVAGFMEGEGSFYLLKPRSSSDLRYPRMSASQKQKQPLERLQELMGGAIYRSAWGGSKSQVPGIWTWCLDGKGVALVASSMRPFMSPRRQEQIDAMVTGEVRRPALGEGNVKTKLRQADVLAIRASADSQKDLAIFYGVDASTISHVQRRKTWTHV